MDSRGKKAGKGALIQTNISATLGTSQDQTLFVPKNIICVATQQGGAEIMYDKCPTITAAAGMSGNNQPIICKRKMGNTYVWEDQANTLASRDYKQPQAVVVRKETNVERMEKQRINERIDLQKRGGGATYAG